MNAIETRDLRLGFDAKLVLDHVDLTIAAGEFIGVFGANGAGKTTLMRAFLGIIAPSRGEIMIFGHPPRRGRREIGYLPQTRAAGPSADIDGWHFVASVVDGDKLGLPLLGKKRRIEVDRALDLVDARELARSPLRNMSGGERQRLLLAQALIGKPRILLLDEPLISLDPHRQSETIRLTKTLQTELGLTILFSAHELNPLLGAMDRVLYLGRGRAAIGAVSEVITTSVLSRLYGAPIDVVRLGERIFVMSGEHDLERDAHRHDGAHAHHHDEPEAERHVRL